MIIALTTALLVNGQQVAPHALSIADTVGCITSLARLDLPGVLCVRQADQHPRSRATPFDLGRPGHGAMPAEHFAALIRRTQPNRSISEITKAAGLPWNRIGYYTRPDTVVDPMPSMASLREISRALDCEVIEVVRAFAADTVLSWSSRSSTPTSTSSSTPTAGSANGTRVDCWTSLGYCLAVDPPPSAPPIAGCARTASQCCGCATARA